MKTKEQIEIQIDLMSAEFTEFLENKYRRYREEFIRDASALKLLDRNINDQICLLDDRKDRNSN